MNIDKKILAKAQRFCAYRERCIKEVKEKLLTLKVNTIEINAYIALLEEQRFINEQRFAIAYTLDKFKLNRWGKHKIKTMLQQKGVSSNYIEEALKHIADIDYEKVAAQLIKNYSKKLNKTPPFQQKQKTLQYMYGKGFDSNLVEKLFTIES